MLWLVGPSWDAGTASRPGPEDVVRHIDPGVGVGSQPERRTRAHPGRPFVPTVVPFSDGGEDPGGGFRRCRLHDVFVGLGEGQARATVRWLGARLSPGAACEVHERNGEHWREAVAGLRDSGTPGVRSPRELRRILELEGFGVEGLEGVDGGRVWDRLRPAWLDRVGTRRIVLRCRFVSLPREVGVRATARDLARLPDGGLG